MSGFDFDLEELQAQIDENARMYESIHGIAPFNIAVNFDNLSVMSPMASDPSFQATLASPISQQGTVAVRPTMKSLENATPIIHTIVQLGRIQFLSDAYGSSGAWNQSPEKNAATEALIQVRNQYIALQDTKLPADRQLPEC
jgi:hypothetical protein